MKALYCSDNPSSGRRVSRLPSVALKAAARAGSDSRWTQYDAVVSPRRYCRYCRYCRHWVALVALVALAGCSKQVRTVEHTQTATVTASPTTSTSPTPTSVQFVVLADSFDTTVSYSTDDVSFTTRPLLGQKKWTMTVPLDPSNTTGAVVLNADDKPSSGESGLLECSLYVEGRLFDRDYYRPNITQHTPAPGAVSCGATIAAIQALTPQS